MKSLGNLSVKINKAANCIYIRHLNLDTNIALHTAAEPAVQAAVKNKLSYRNDAIIAFFFEANKNKENAIIAFASSNN